MRRRMRSRQPRGEQERKPGSQQEKRGAGGAARPALTNGGERLSQAAQLPPSSAALPPRCIRCSSSPCRARLGSARPGPARPRRAPPPARPPPGAVPGPARLGMDPYGPARGEVWGSFPAQPGQKCVEAAGAGAPGAGCSAAKRRGAGNREKRKAKPSQAISGWGLAVADLDSFSQMTFKSQVFSIRLKKKKIKVSLFTHGRTGNSLLSLPSAAFLNPN